jgi:glyoxylase-like metal-dependent hydrolase (beta-lactamase superfamily II)
MPTEIVDDVYDITLKEGTIGRIRAYLVDDDVPTLYDTGYEGMEEVLLDGIEQIGVKPKRVVVTHDDPDHVGCVDAVVEKYGAGVWVHEDEVFDMPETTPDRRFSDGDQVGRFRVVHIPGHTPGTCAFVDEDGNEGDGVAILGDTVFGSDFRGLPPGYLVSPTSYFSADYVAAEENLESLLAYDFDVGLVYHGSNATENASRKLDAYVGFPGKA